METNRYDYKATPAVHTTFLTRVGQKPSQTARLGAEATPGIYENAGKRTPQREGRLSTFCSESRVRREGQASPTPTPQPSPPCAPGAKALRPRAAIMASGSSEAVARGSLRRPLPGMRGHRAGAAAQPPQPRPRAAPPPQRVSPFPQPPRAPNPAAPPSPGREGAALGARASEAAREALGAHCRARSVRAARAAISRRPPQRRSSAEKEAGGGRGHSRPPAPQVPASPTPRPPAGPSRPALGARRWRTGRGRARVRRAGRGRQAGGFEASSQPPRLPSGPCRPRPGCQLAAPTPAQPALHRAGAPPH